MLNVAHRGRRGRSSPASLGRRRPAPLGDPGASGFLVAGGVVGLVAALRQPLTDPVLAVVTVVVAIAAALVAVLR